MAADNQLQARIQPSHAECITDIATQRDIAETEVEREVVREGLAAMGYVSRPTNGLDLFEWYLRRIGLVLGVVGIIMMGFGVFWPRIYSLLGFSLLIGGFLFVALEELLKTLDQRREAADANLGEAAGQ